MNTKMEPATKEGVEFIKDLSKMYRTNMNREATELELSIMEKSNMKTVVQNPAILIKDPKTGEPTHVLIQDVETKEKTFYKLEPLSLEELAELIKI